MIRHIVAFRLNGANAKEKAQQAAGVRERLLPLKDAIENVLDLELGDDLGLVGTHWDLVLVADYPDNAALESYQAHPLHRRALEWIDDVVESRAVVDYERA